MVVEECKRNLANSQQNIPNRRPIFYCPGNPPGEGCLVEVMVGKYEDGHNYRVLIVPNL